MIQGLEGLEKWFRYQQGFGTGVKTDVPTGVAMGVRTLSEHKGYGYMPATAEAAKCVLVSTLSFALKVI